MAFAGFPFKSDVDAKRLKDMAMIVNFWGFGRIFWAILALFQGGLQLFHFDFSQLSDLSYVILIATAFVFCEVGDKKDTLQI